MKMLYGYSQLKKLEYGEIKIPLSRYLFKFSNYRKEIRKLKTHEKDFLFENMSLLRNEKDELSFDLTSIDEASEYYFNRLILTYFKNLNFDKPTKNHYNQVVEKESMEVDKVNFDNYYNQWVQKLETKKGKYLSNIHIELNRRLKKLRSNYNSGKIEDTEYNYQTKKLYSVAFFIYYKVKLFFDGLTDKFVTLNVLGEDIIINIYSFVHILFRHYFPTLDNENTDRSINDPLPFVDIDYLPYSVRDFLSKYFDCNKAPIDSTREYLLLSFAEDKYIIWLKYMFLEELNNTGFEFRTLYKCQEKRDLDKFIELTEHPVNLDLSFYF